MRVKIIFDKEAINDKLFKGWGISYLIGEKFLFDVGEKSEYVLKNMDMLGIDMKRIEKVIISHNRWNHIGGLWGLLKINKNIEVYACSDFIKEFKDKMYGCNLKEVGGFEEITEQIYTSGYFKALYKDNMIEEQSLIVKTKKGISIICGCAHPGLLEIVHRVKELFPALDIYAVFGGFHLIDKDRRFVRYVVEKLKRIGIKKVGPSHCSGFEAIAYFNEVFKNNLLDIKTGIEFEI